MGDLGIVFSHHDTSPAARQNLEALRRLNPEARLFTLSAGEPFPGGYRVRDLGEGGRIWSHLTKGDKTLEWRNCDWLPYAWIQSGIARCSRWAFVGWDVYSTMPLAEFLKAVWDRDFAVVACSPPSDTSWVWFRDDVPESLFPHRCGVGPTCFFFSSDSCARAIALRALEFRDWRGFCELRLGTFARSLGVEIAIIEGAHRTISWRWEGWQIEGRGVWHPVKSLVELVPKDPKG
jgi:hypothetical protein